MARSRSPTRGASATKAKDLLKEGKDPSTEKQFDKHRQAAARPFEQWADERLAKKKIWNATHP
jgi:hypothetical protein